MNRIWIAILVIALALLTAGCGAINTLTGGGNNMKPVAQLWSDVPRMNGMTPSQQVDMPAELKVLARPIMDGMMRGLNNGADAGRWDWTGFTLSGKTPADVQAFYTPERMATYGWQPEGGCMSPNLSGDQVIFCAFQKQEGNKTAGLLIIAANDKEHKATSIFFMRQEVEGSTPMPGSRPSAPATASSGSVSNGPVPYGIDRRPMPTGLNLDTLLPRQVGPYTRESLRRLGSDTPPTSAQIDDGNPIYAEYRSGSTKIFVEFGVSSSAEFAQEALRVAAGDVAGGEFPTDPRFGALGREPSYLKVINADGAFFAWTRGGYYFSASAPSEAALDAFMQAFPY